MEQIFTMPDAPCPVCRKTANAADDLGDQSPRPPAADDVTVCIGCGAILVFQENLQLRLAEQADLDSLDPATTRLLWKLVEHQARAARPGRP